MSSYQLDHIDQKILSFLVKNARMPFLEIARECNVSGAAIHQRVKRLETNGVITGSRILVKPQALGLNVCAFVSVASASAKPDSGSLIVSAVGYYNNKDYARAESLLKHVLAEDPENDAAMYYLGLCSLS